MFNWLQPNLVLDTVRDITPELLRTHGLRSLLLDVDTTLKRYKATEIPPETVQWIEMLKNTGIQLCLLSNGRKPRIALISEQIGLPFIAPALKPLPFRCLKAIKSMGFDPKATGIVGDQVFTDILVGKWAGIFTILVTPIHPEDEHWYTRIKRPVERWVIKHSVTSINHIPQPKIHHNAQVRAATTFLPQKYSPKAGEKKKTKQLSHLQRAALNRFYAADVDNGRTDEKSCFAVFNRYAVNLSFHILAERVHATHRFANHTRCRR